MDESRLQELERKRDDVGLNREEADELGRMIAEIRGEPYSNADDHETPEMGPRLRRDDRSYPGPKTGVGRDPGSSESDRE